MRDPQPTPQPHRERRRGGAGRDVEAARPQAPIPSGRLVRVFATANIPEGMLVKGMLEADGIPVFVKGESEGPYRIGPVYLWVPDEFEIQARMLLEEAQSEG